MNPKFRFDLANSRIYFLTSRGEMALSFTETVKQLRQLADQQYIFRALGEQAKLKSRRGPKETRLHRLITTYINSGLTSTIYLFLFDSFTEYADWHIQGLMKNCMDKQGYIREHIDPCFEQILSLLSIFWNTNPGTELSDLSLVEPIHAEVISGRFYYSSVFSFNAFLLLFWKALIINDLEICKCSVCGEIFCGKPNDDCCGSIDCKAYLENAGPSQKKDELAKLSRNFSGNIRQYRSQIRLKCVSPKAVEEFDAFVQPKQDAFIREVKELRYNDAPYREILLQKKKGRKLYAEINAKVNEIVGKYGSGI